MMLDPNLQRAFIKELQVQYGTLWRAANIYLDGKMGPEQSAKLEVAAMELIGVVSRQRFELAISNAILRMVATVEAAPSPA